MGFCDRLNQIAPSYQTRVWYQPTYARRGQMARYQAEGYQGCTGRTLDRISVFPDGRCYVCSYLAGLPSLEIQRQARTLTVEDEKTMMETVIEPLRSLDWEDTDAVEAATVKALAMLTAQRRTLRDILLDLPEWPDLLGLCEHYDILDKIVLHN